jgi:hypothetical protein
MSDHENFEDRLRAFADQLNRSVQRFSEFDLDELADRYGVDSQQARAFADMAGQWLSDRMSGGDPLFSQPEPGTRPSRPSRPAPAPSRPEGAPARSGGPHPLDAPTEAQGLALAALDSGRWTVRPGSNALAGSGIGPEPTGADLVGELRARDWIAVDGGLTLAGRNALARWARAGQEAAGEEAAEGPSAP